MSDRINDGGPAFPLENAGTEFRTGMSLRDWFAGQALVEYASYSDLKVPATAKYVAQACYFMADAMIAAREGKA